MSALRPGIVRRPPFVAALTLACLVSPALAQPAGWQTSGPNLASVNAISAVPDTAVVYAGGSNYQASESAIFRSDDGGRTWTPLFAAARGDYVSDLLVDPRDGTRVFAGVQSAGGLMRIYRTSDSGANWSELTSVSTVCVPSFAAGSGPDAILFSCGTRLLRSPDAGLTWSEPATPFTETTRLAPAPGGVLLAYGSTKIFRSTDDGLHWSPAADAPPACPGMLVVRVAAADANVLVAGTGLLGSGGFQCGGIFRSADAGHTWTAGGLAGVYVTDVSLDARDLSSLYASASFIPGILPRGGVFRSTDGGATWTNLRLPGASAVRLALSNAGRLLHAATKLGAFELGIRKTQVVGPRE